MRAFVIMLFVAAAPIYFAATFFGNGSDFGIGRFSNLGDIGDRVAASDFAHNALGDARDYAASHPQLVDDLKAHRAEIEEFRSRVCSALEC